MNRLKRWGAQTALTTKLGRHLIPDVELGRAGAYREYLDALWLRFSILAMTISVVMVPLFSALDWIVYPEEFALFLLLRIGCALSVAALVAGAIMWARRLLPVASIASLTLIQVMICYMIFVTDGQDSGYYAGLNLPIIAIGLFLPASVVQAGAFVAASAGSYTLACVWEAEGNLGGAFVENLFFILATGIIAAYATRFLEERRRTEFSLAYELEARVRELDYLNRKRSDFFSNVSHELRTPLTLILAPVQELLSGRQPLSDPLAGRLMVVRDNGLRLLKLVNEMLDLVRLEEGAETLRESPIDLNRLLRGVCDSMLHLAEAKGLSLSRQQGNDPVVVKGDGRALEKIMLNLIGNAIKFTPEGGSVVVTTRVAGAEAIIEVSDTGIGIDPAEQGHIFERFRQADTSSTRRYRGSGLGLSLVKEMTERMDGSVAVLSALGEGTKMVVRFPRCADAPVDQECDDAVDALQSLHRLADRQGGIALDAPVFSEQGAGFDDASGDARGTVLIVEDEPDMRRYLAEVLEEDFRVLQARDGREGLETALAREPDLVLLDLMLPEMDGLEVCRRIRADERGHSFRIMLLTARADEQSKLTALENGANDFLTKPFSTVEVLTRLKNLLENARLERDLAARNLRLERTLKDLESTQAQLIQSEKLNALGSLSAGLLHEINNPLNYSLTALQLLSGDPDLQEDELKREILGDIQEGMQRIRTIVSDLRAFAYPSEADKQGRFDFNEAVDAALRFTAHDIRGIEVARELPQPAMISGSKSHLTQVLVNLFVNAAKAIAAVGGEHAGRIRVSGAFVDGRLSVEVSDNGVGMEATTLGRIFDPFFTTRDVGEGMGLGLSICHTIIANHRGTLSATSRPGEGSELRFDLPESARELAMEDA